MVTITLVATYAPMWPYMPFTLVAIYAPMWPYVHFTLVAGPQTCDPVACIRKRWLNGLHYIAATVHVLNTRMK